MSHPYVKVATSLQNCHHTSNIKPTSSIAMTATQRACPMAAFSGFYESPGPPPSGDAHDSTTASRCPLKRPSKWVHITSLYCLLSPWRPLGWYGVSSRPMAASSGFRSIPGHAALGDAACIASTPPHGHQNGLRLRCICSSPPPFSHGVIIAKDHVMVHFLNKTPSYYSTLIGVINIFVYYGPPPTTMDALSATIVAGGRAQFQ
jgi:hypothetical protein